LEYLFAGHDVQVETDIAPTTFEYVPAVHRVHVTVFVVLEYVPAGQGKHAADPGIEYVPVGQGIHADPNTEYVPAGQIKHADDPGTEYVPFRQGIHAEPGTEYIPAEQGIHINEPSISYPPLHVILRIKPLPESATYKFPIESIVIPVGS
jgi:hypothetical protein